MRSVVLLLALSIFGVAPPQGPESPGLTLYRQLGLPLPPRDAELVVLKKVYMTVGTQEGTFYPKSIAWRIRTAMGNLYMAGPVTVSAQREVQESYKDLEEALPVTEAEALKFPMIACHLDSPFAEDPMLALALQAESMGMPDLSLKIMKSPTAGSRSTDLDENPSVESRVAMMAYELTLAGFLEKDFDRKALTARLGTLAKRLPKRDYGRVFWSLKSFRAALRPLSAKPGSTEWLIDQWVNSREMSSVFGGTSPTAYDPILACGLQVVPNLIAHLDDDRATLTFQGGMNNGYAGFRTVADICETLLANLMSARFINRGWLYTDQKPKEWWKQVRSKNERNYLESVVFPTPEEVKEVVAGGFHATVPTNPVALRMLVLRFPESIPDLYKGCLKHDGVGSQDVAVALFESSIPASQKAALFEEGADSKTAEHRSTAVGLLKKLKATPIAPVLVNALSVQKPFGDGNYGTSPAADLARQVLSSSSSEAFEALAKAMKGAELGYRVEAMSAFRYLGDDKLSVATQRLVFGLLEQFKDDDELYDPSKHAFGYLADEAAKKDKWQRSSALMEFETALAARDFAFVCIAELLGDERERSTTWSLAQWAQFRTRIRDKLAEWRAEHGGAPLRGDWFR